MNFGVIEMLGAVLFTLAAVWVASTVKRGAAKTARKQWRFVLLIRVVGLVAGILVGASLAASSSSRLMMIAPGVVGLFVILGVIVGEAFIKSPAVSGSRSAAVAPRRISDYVDKKAFRMALVLTGVHVITLVFTSLTASTDDLGRSGRAIGYEFANGSTSRTPYPGTYYTVWQIMLLIGLILLTALALYVVVKRPRGYANALTDEDSMRRTSVATVVAAFGLSVALSQVGIAGIAAIQLISSGQSNSHAGVTPPAWMLPSGIVLAVTVVFAIAVGFILAIRVFSAPKEVSVDVAAA